MKIIKPYTEIITPINYKNILKHIELAGRVCYKSEDKISDESAEKFIAGIIKRGHESVIEHFSITVKFVCDRGISHEIVRHRIAAYSQESTRYCNYSDDKFGKELTFILPEWVNEAVSDKYDIDWNNLYGVCKNEPLLDRAETRWFWSMALAERDYLELLELGWVPQQARSVLPNALKTEIMVTFNLREWRHFFKLRCSPAAHPQMRELSIPLLKEFSKLMPVFFKDIEEQVNHPIAKARGL